MRVLRVVLVVLVAGACLAFAPTAGAQTAVPFEPCGAAQLALCGKVEVPLDRSGALPGTVRLHVRRVPTLPPGLGAPRGAVFALAGGPGQAATPFAEYVGFTLGKALRGREIVTFDQRGTGRSGTLRCPTLESIGENLLNVSGAGADCAANLGPKRAKYTTRDSVEDLEAVRRALGIERIALYGVSYGTKLALAYAAAYPNNVERLLLDSVVGVDGPDPFLRDSLSAIPRMLRTLCGPRCAAFTQDPVADMTALVTKLTGGLMRGPLVRPDGEPHEARIGRARLLGLLFAGDFDPTLRAALPAAVRSALNGDPAPILRLARVAGRVQEEPVSYFSPAVYAATTCEEGPLPWDRAAPPAARLDQAHAAFAPTTEQALAPFDRLTTFVTSPFVQLCRQWPTTPVDPALGSTFPPVPALLIAGEDDLRTPLETARQVATRLTRATVLAVPDAAHSALDWPSGGCGRRAVAAFFADRPIKPCKRNRRMIPLEPIAPTAISQLRPAGGVSGRPGQTLAAVQRTLRDTGLQVFSLTGFEQFVASALGQGGIPGLRGGRANVKSYGLELERLEYVPGVRLDGELRGEQLSRGFIRISGPAAARGRLALRRGRLSGRLGGKAVRLTLPAHVLGGEAQGVPKRKRKAGRLRPRSHAGTYPLPPLAPGR